MEESKVSKPNLEPKPCEKYSKARVQGMVEGRVQGWWNSPRPVNPSLNPCLMKTILRKGSKEGFKDGRVQGWWKSPRPVNPSLVKNILRKGSTIVEESTAGEPILVKNIRRQGSKEVFKDGGRVHNR
ncbi:hypothetical protein H5410_056715 [Solanum commersonii]|uniref:Uncharacterized protein n=1 Tax=Solanum commersonii TaxID=4109 RepID=A0A9J5WMK0_SOLCO|nr:hypothetical protein H5410_056715 [Solanum commersonii]